MNETTDSDCNYTWLRVLQTLIAIFHIRVCRYMHDSMKTINNKRRMTIDKPHGPNAVRTKRHAEQQERSTYKQIRTMCIHFIHERWIDHLHNKLIQPMIKLDSAGFVFVSCMLARNGFQADSYWIVNVFIQKSLIGQVSHVVRYWAMHWVYDW